MAFLPKNGNSIQKKFDHYLLKYGIALFEFIDFCLKPNPDLDFYTF